MLNIALRFVAFVFVANILTACVNKEDIALKEFKTSQEGLYIAQCAGAVGAVDWKISFPQNQSNPNVRIIEAIVTKPSKTEHLQVQWLYNLDTKVSEVAYASKDGKETNRLSMGMDIGLFCM